MVDHQDGFFLPTSGGRINSSCMNMMERGGGSWKPNAELSPPACPRCGSSNTKFCYYNNYSLTQPRYFCKGCRRYWTKGGSLRNVPIGGGCRKSRRSHHIKPSSPPIRVPSTTNNIHGPSPFGLISATPKRHSPNSTSTTPGTSSSDGPNIDLAVVFANFLNPNKPQPHLENASCHDHHHQQHERVTQLPNDTNNNPRSSLEFLGVHNNLHLDLPAPCHQQDGSDDLIHDGNYIVYHSGGLDSIHHHHHHSFTNVKNNNDPSSNIINSNNYVLPPLPDDEEMVWPSSISMTDLIMLPTHQILDVDYTSPRSSSLVQPQGQNCQRLPNGNDDMSSLINISNIDDIFKS